MKKVAVAIALLLILAWGGMIMIFRGGVPQPNAVGVNDAVMSAMQSEDWDEARDILEQRLADEYERMEAERRRENGRLTIGLCLFVGVFTLAIALLYLYCERSILRPFRRLRHFARNVASGNLDIPLEMDRHGRFGAFTESFDIMRSELKQARENERKASQSKKELVASLSHDVKTPIASIKAVAELMLVKPVNGEEEAQLAVILSKADQIDLLVTNMFHATLEELEQLKVLPEAVPSTVLGELVRNADYDHKVRLGEIPECVVTADLTRLQQVFDNVISNSYKYAGTAIEVTAWFEGRYLAIKFADGGPGVAPDELPLVCEKFYRGGNAAGKGGSGLGLYITKHLLGKMGGDVRCEVEAGGFAVVVLLAM